MPARLNIAWSAAEKVDSGGGVRSSQSFASWISTAPPLEVLAIRATRRSHSESSRGQRW